MKAILVQQKCKEAIEDEEKLQVELTAVQKPEVVKRAHSAILLSLTDEVLREVADETTAAGLWKKLQSKYQKRSLSNKLYQKRQLHTLKMSEDMQITEHLDKFNRIVLDLRGVGLTLMMRIKLCFCCIHCLSHIRVLLILSCMVEMEFLLMM